MEFKVANINEKGSKFTIIAVSENVLSSDNKELLRKRFEQILKQPVVFMGDIFSKVFDGKESYVQILKQKDIAEINDFPWEPRDL